MLTMSLIINYGLSCKQVLFSGGAIFRTNLELGIYIFIDKSFSLENIVDVSFLLT